MNRRKFCLSIGLAPIAATAFPADLVPHTKPARAKTLTLISGSAGTYTSPSNPTTTMIRIRMVGGGGGGTANS